MRLDERLSGLAGIGRIKPQKYPFLAALAVLARMAQTARTAQTARMARTAIFAGRLRVDTSVGTVHTGGVTTRWKVASTIALLALAAAILAWSRNPALALALLILAVAVAGWFLSIKMCFGARGTKLLKTCFLLAVGVVAVVSYFLTFHLVYFPNINTRYQGWPIPTVVFQRTGPEAPWLDFVGPTTLLGYPLNVLLIGGYILGLSWLVRRVLFGKVQPTDHGPGV
jgi:hypothetical protein